jgi:uncharacterized protein YceK
MKTQLTLAVLLAVCILAAGCTSIITETRTSTATPAGQKAVTESD